MNRKLAAIGLVTGIALIGVAACEEQGREGTTSGTSGRASDSTGSTVPKTVETGTDTRPQTPTNTQRPATGTPTDPPRPGDTTRPGDPARPGETTRPGAQAPADPARPANPTTPSVEPAPSADGLIKEDLKLGEGDTANEGDRVLVHYRGTLRSDGKEFDSSIGKDPVEFVLTSGPNGVIEGWVKGVAGMKEGGRRKLTVPAKMGYGERGYPGLIPPNSDLVFEIELIEVRK
ncbi:MAG TPA: FKBP-type peptidyl-prolyl cis-trans isomerase [Phycisphaerales bacterium]|nr:FKBP-type peptidyl-prolyl cis-trans isomerase [Phycisphaerales bacterium]